MTIWGQIAIGLFIGAIFCVIGLALDERTNNECLWKIPFYMVCGVVITLCVCWFIGV